MILIVVGLNAHPNSALFFVISDLIVMAFTIEIKGVLIGGNTNTLALISSHVLDAGSCIQKAD
jgi:hypothetical protein